MLQTAAGELRARAAANAGASRAPAPHVSQAKHLNISAAAAGARREHVGDLAYMSVLQTSELYLDQAGAQAGMDSSWVTASLCLVFVVIVFCTIYLLTAQFRAQDTAAGDRLARLADSRLPGTDKGRLPSVQKVPGRSGPLPGPSPYGSAPMTGTLPSGQKLPSNFRSLPPPLPPPTSGYDVTAPPTLSSTSVPSRLPPNLSMGCIGGEEDLPQIYPELIMNAIRARLFVPAEPLHDESFVVDVLGSSGRHSEPLMIAALAPRLGGTSSIEITGSSEERKVMACVGPSLQIFDGRGNVGATLRPLGDGSRLAVCDANGVTRMVLAPGDGPGEVRLFSEVDGRNVDRATLTMRAPSNKFPVNHYEAVVMPGVDSVLCLACFLALIVYAIPGRTA